MTSTKPLVDELSQDDRKRQIRRTALLLALLAAAFYLGFIAMSVFGVR